MNSNFNLYILTPKKICFNDKIKQITFSSINGYITILPNHQNIVGLISPNFADILDINDSKQKILMNYGIFSFENNKLTILTDYFASSNRISLDEILNNQKVINNELQYFSINKKTNEFLKSFLNNLAKVTKTNN